MSDPTVVHGFGTARPGDYYDSHLWKELLRGYAVLCNSDCDDPAIRAEAQRRHNIVLQASEGRLPREAFFFETPIPPAQLDAVIDEINAALCDPRWTRPRQLNLRLQVPSKTLGKDVVVGIASAFIADLQNWAAQNCVLFRPTPAMWKEMRDRDKR